MDPRSALPQPYPALPTAAERARTVLQASPMLEIMAAGVTETVSAHTTDDYGRALVRVSDRSPLAALMAGSRGPVPTLVHASSLRPVPVPDRVRARVELCGYLDVVRRPAEHVITQLRRAGGGTPSEWGSGFSLLRAEVLAVTIDGTIVDPDDYAVAAPDPLVEEEAACLRHLLRDHVGVLAEMCGSVEPQLLADATRIAPSGLDRLGLTVWLAGPSFVHEIRFPFAAPVDRPAHLPRALHHMLAHLSQPRRQP